MAIEGVGPLGRPAAPAGARGMPAAPGFGDALGAALDDVRLSRHAERRIERRELDLGVQGAERLTNAIQRAAAKGARTSVVMLDDLALVVDVRQRMVVTAMHQSKGEGRVFTNIDSVVIG